MMRFSLSQKEAKSRAFNVDLMGKNNWPFLEIMGCSISFLVLELGPVMVTEAVFFENSIILLALVRM